MLTSNEIFSDAVRRAMKLKGLAQEDILARLGYSRRSLVDGFSFEKMCELEFLLDTPADVLWKIDSAEDASALLQARKVFEGRFCTAEAIDWAQRFPIRELQRLGYICKTEGLTFNKRFKSGLLPREIMKFMGVASLDGWKKTYTVAMGTVNPHVYSAWIRLGEIQVDRPSSDFFISRDIIANNLKFLRRNALPLKENLRQIVIDTLRKCDIAVLEVPAFLMAPAPKVVCFWRGLQPVVQLPTISMSDGEFMESVYHAMGHILQSHSKRPCLLAPKTVAGMIAAAKNGCIEANRVAESLLMTEAEECELICCGRFAEKACIEFFSRKFQIRPGIIVSRLQRLKKIRRDSPLNSFKIAV
jgi:transcriptional regulator with XRE-family HTH domain